MSWAPRFRSQIQSAVVGASAHHHHHHHHRTAAPTTNTTATTAAANTSATTTLTTTPLVASATSAAARSTTTTTTTTTTSQHNSPPPPPRSSSSSTAPPPPTTNTVLLREWRSESPPVAPAVVVGRLEDVVENADNNNNNDTTTATTAGNSTTAAATTPASTNGAASSASQQLYSYTPVATFVQNVQNFVYQLHHTQPQQQQQQPPQRPHAASEGAATASTSDSTLLPLSIRSEGDLDDPLIAPVTGYAPPTAHIQDVLDAEADVDIVLVDGEMIAVHHHHPQHHYHHHQLHQHYSDTHNQNGNTRSASDTAIPSLDAAGTSTDGIDQDRARREREAQDDIEFRIRQASRQDCQPSRMRRGMRKISKILFRRGRSKHQQHQQGAPPSDDNLPVSTDNVGQQAPQIVEHLQEASDLRVLGRSSSLEPPAQRALLEVDTAAIPSGSRPTSPLVPAPVPQQPETQQQQQQPAANLKKPPPSSKTQSPASNWRSRKQRNNNKKKPSWRRTDSSGAGEEDNDAFIQQQVRFQDPDSSVRSMPSMSSSAAPSATLSEDSLGQDRTMQTTDRTQTAPPFAFLPTSTMAPPSAEAPGFPNMTPMHEARTSTNGSTMSSSSASRAQSVTASYVGPADQLMGMETGYVVDEGQASNNQHAPFSMEAAAAVAYFEDPYLNDDELRKKMEEASMPPSVVPADADYKVDKADAPDVESMLRRAQEETCSDISDQLHSSSFGMGGGLGSDEEEDAMVPPPPPRSSAGRIMHHPGTAASLHRGKSDGSSIPLSRATISDEVVHNDLLKIVLVSEAGVDKSWVGRSIRGSHKRPRKRTTMGVDVHTWNPNTEESGDLRFPIYDIQGTSTVGSMACHQHHAIPNEGPAHLTLPLAGSPLSPGVASSSATDGGQPNFGAHPGTQSLFFSAQTLYLLIWDLACTKAETYHRQRKRPDHDDDDDDDTDEDSDHDEDDDDYEDEFIREEANRQADRALHADISNRVLSWVDCIALRGPKSAILPVAIIPPGMTDFEVKRRCDMMHFMLDEHVRRFARDDYFMPPKLLAGAEDNILCVNYADGHGVEQLRETILDIATDSSRSVFEHVGTPVPAGTVLVRDALKRFQKDHKLILLDHLVGDVGDALPVEQIIGALHFLASVGEVLYYGNNNDEILSKYIILSRKWFVSALSCILRNDLKRELAETRRFMQMQCIYSDHSFAENDVAKALLSGETSSCPLLSDNDAKLLWLAMSFMREAADKYSMLDESSTTSSTMFDFLERVLVSSGIFLPLGATTNAGLDQSEVFFVPSLLAQADPVWTYKSSQSWMTTLCYSWLFRDGAPPHLMEHVTVGLLRDLYAFSRDCQGVVPRQGMDRMTRSQTVPLGTSSMNDFVAQHDSVGRVKIYQIVCWKWSMAIKIGACFADSESGEIKESFVEVMVAIVDQSSAQCVASDAMRPSMHRVVVSGKGQVGHHGLKLWKGGFQVVLDSVRNSLSNYANVDSQVVCPECLAHSNPRTASTWSWDSVLAVAGSGSTVVRCMRGHRVDSNLICGSCRSGPKSAPPTGEPAALHRQMKPVAELLPSVVLVGLFDPKKKEIRSVGSGFIVDKKLGLIVTAGHVLFNMKEGREFGSPYMGIRDAKVVVGVIPENGENAVFRYFADIVADEVQNVDACVLRIRTRMENDVDDEGAGCAEQPEQVLALEDIPGLSLKSLKLASRYEIEESVRILGFNQGGEGVLERGKHVNRSADYAQGYVCKKFKANVSDDSSSSDASAQMNFLPREEVVVMCYNLPGHSGGPCVNEEGKVLGILSRADPVDRQRCYLVPSTELKALVSKAKKVSRDGAAAPHKVRSMSATLEA